MIYNEKFDDIHNIFFTYYFFNNMSGGNPNFNKICFFFDILHTFLIFYFLGKRIGSESTKGYNFFKLSFI